MNNGQGKLTRSISRNKARALLHIQPGTSVPCLKEKAQIITDVPELIKYGPGLLEDDSDMSLATLAAVKEASSPSRIDLCHIW